MQDYIKPTSFKNKYATENTLEISAFKHPRIIIKKNQKITTVSPSGTFLSHKLKYP
jgi:hypothetical protein